MLEIELFSSISNEESQEQVPDWAKLDIDGLRADAAATDWTKLLDEKDTESMWNVIKSKIDEISRKNLPTRRKRT